MAFHQHPLCVAAACVISLSLTACSSNSDTGGDDNEVIVPQGLHYGYVVSGVSVPTTSAESAQFGLDLGGATSTKLDGKADNKLGDLLALLNTFQFDLETPLTAGINQGVVNLLVDLQTTDFSNAAAAGVTLKFGASPNPAPCTGASDTTCGHHLTGSASFQIASDSPSDAAAAGEIIGGAFSGGPSSVSVRLGLGGDTTSTLRLLQGRVRIAGISAAGIMTGTLGGLIPPDELKSQLGPPLLAILNQTVDTDCTGTRTPPGCGCGAASKGSIVFSIVDQDKNCALTIEEMFGNATVGPMLQPGSCSKESCTAPDTLSLGVRFKAVKATFPM